jgi:hypothetical protein
MESDGFDVSDSSAGLFDSSVGLGPEDGDGNDELDSDVLGSEEVDSDEVADDFDSDGESSAHAVPGVVARAPPMPSATARAPTRPMYLPYTVVTCRLGFGRRAVCEFDDDDRTAATAVSRLLGRVGCAVVANAGGDGWSPAGRFHSGSRGITDFITTPTAMRISRR